MHFMGDGLGCKAKSPPKKMQRKKCNVKKCKYGGFFCRVYRICFLAKKEFLPAEVQPLEGLQFSNL